MTVRRYTRVAIWLHWIVAALVLANIALAFSWSSLPDAQVRPAIDLHKSFGITVLGLVILRLLWRLSHPAPPMPARYAAWERRLAHGVHWTFYAVLLAMPLTGWIMDSAYKDADKHPLNLYGVIPWFRFSGITHLDPARKLAVHDQFAAAHGLIGWVIIALVVLHVAGALKHQFVNGDPELQRMGLGRVR